MEDPLFIRLRIAHYHALLGTKLADDARSRVQRLLGEAEISLADLPSVPASVSAQLSR
jgi:hypothetical protein